MPASLASLSTSSQPSSTIGATTIASTPWLMKLRTAAICALGLVVGGVEDQLEAVLLGERRLHRLGVGAAPAALGAGLGEADLDRTLAAGRVAARVVVAAAARREERQRTHHGEPGTELRLHSRTSSLGRQASAG